MIFQKGPLVGLAIAVTLLAALLTIVALPPAPGSRAAAAEEVKLVDTCPQGYLLHHGNYYLTRGAVCVPGYLPSKKPANPDLKAEGRQ